MMNRIGSCKRGPIILFLSLLCSMHGSFSIAETEFELEDFRKAIFRLAIGESAHIRSMGLMSNSRIIADSTIYQTDLAIDKLEFDVADSHNGTRAGLVAKIDKHRYSPISPPPLCTPQYSDQSFRLDFREILLLPSYPSAAIINVGRSSGHAVRELIFDDSGLLLASDRSTNSIGHLLALQGANNGGELKLESIVRIEEKVKPSKIKGYVTAAISSLIPVINNFIKVHGELRLMKGTTILGTWNWGIKIPLSEVFLISENRNRLADRLDSIRDLKIGILRKLNCIDREPYRVSIAGQILRLNAGEADGFRIGDRFLLFPGSEIFKSHGIASALESVAIAEIVRSNQQSALLHMVEGNLNLRSGIIMNAKSIRLML
ncbi:MAG TPA: hypothetical protein EYQ22_08155 [Gammaproteobacteria bacterium]|nr:hypothetical protein [Gammaproteobacteria bacterium]HIK69373.1 hypothetical protein [Pseudomonadales bacterium]